MSNLRPSATTVKVATEILQLFLATGVRILPLR